MALLNAEVKNRAMAATKTLSRFGKIHAAYIFGSHVDGGADQWSDIDVAVFMDGIEKWDMRSRSRAMALVQKEAGIDVEAHLFSASALKSEPGSFAEYIRRKGFILDIEK